MSEEDYNDNLIIEGVEDENFNEDEINKQNELLKSLPQKQSNQKREKYDSADDFIDKNKQKKKNSDEK